MNSPFEEFFKCLLRTEGQIDQDAEANFRCVSKSFKVTLRHAAPINLQQRDDWSQKSRLKEHLNQSVKGFWLGCEEFEQRRKSIKLGLKSWRVEQLTVDVQKSRESDWRVSSIDERHIKRDLLTRSHRVTLTFAQTSLSLLKSKFSSL